MFIFNNDGPPQSTRFESDTDPDPLVRGTDPDPSIIKQK